MKSSHSEQTVLAWGMLVGVICVTGSLLTGRDPIQFFFLGVAWLVGFCIVGAIVVSIIVFVFRLVYLCLTMERDELREILKEEYSLKTVRNGYKIVYDHTKELTDEFRRSDLPLSEKLSHLDSVLTMLIGRVKGK